MKKQQYFGIRRCINCVSGDAQLMFKFTKKWLTKVRKVPQEWLDNNKLDLNFSSSLVGSNYRKTEFFTEKSKSK